MTRNTGFFPVFVALIAGLSSAVAVADEIKHPFLAELRSARVDGIMVLLPPFNPLAKEQAKQFHSGKAVDKIIPGARVLLLDPESSVPEERALIKEYSLGESATTLAIDADGKPFAADLGLAAADDTLAKFLSDAVKAKKTRDEAFTAAGAAEGGGVAKSIDAALAAVPEGYWMPFYSAEIDKLIKSADAATPGLRDKYQDFLKRHARQSDVRALLVAVLENVDPKSATIDEVLKRFDHELAVRNLPPESRQSAEMHRFRYLAKAQRYEDALKSLDLAESLAPETKLAKNIPRFRDRIKVAMQKPKPGSPPSEKPKEPELPR